MMGRIVAIAGELDMLLGRRTCEIIAAAWRVAAGIAVVAAVSCETFAATRNSGCDPNAPASLDAARRDSIGSDDPHDTPDTHWAEVARQLPGGFAGAYVEHQRFVIRLARPEEGKAHLSSLLAAISRDVGGVVLDSGAVLVEPAEWDFAQLDEWRRYLDPRLGVPGIAGTDADEVANRVVYGVVSDSARDTILARLRALHVPCGLVRLTRTNYAVPVDNMR